MSDFLLSIQIPEGLATAIFGAALLLLLIAMFGNKEISIKEITIGRVNPAGRILAGALGVGFLVLSLVSFVSPPVNEEVLGEPVDEGSAEPDVAMLPAPEPASPACDATIEWPPRERFFILGWERVDGASTYTVEVDCFRCFAVVRWASEAGEPWHIREGLGLRSPIYSSEIHHLLYEQEGLAIRWRVWAVGHDGDEGTKSEWCQVSFFGTRPD
jgi:hypothetical protein